MKRVAWAICFFIVVSTVIWVIRLKILQMDAYFDPREEEIRHDTFEKSSAYQHGMVQELQSMQVAYIQADKEGKEALASIILHRVASFQGPLPKDLDSFIQTLKRERGL